MTDRPYVLLSCAVSLDGYIDDGSADRLVLSGAADLDRVDAVRADSDAILVGAATIRRDDPRLLLRSSARREARLARGLPATPLRVTITGSGRLDASSRIFTAGDGGRIVYAATSVWRSTQQRVGAVSEVVDAGDPVDLVTVLADLATRGVQRLMVEGGSVMHTMFLTADLVDELQLAVAPFFIGDSRAPRFVGDGAFPRNPKNRARLIEATTLEDMVLLRYALSERCPDR